jgi:uncharacterized protein YjdB
MAATITTNKGTYQITAEVLPLNATDRSLTWTVDANATVSPTGLVTATKNGVATVRAAANDGSGIFGTIGIVISNQVIPVTSIILT